MTDNTHRIMQTQKKTKGKKSILNMFKEIKKNNEKELLETETTNTAFKKKKKIEAPKELKDKNPESDGGGRTSVKDTNAK